MRHEMMRQLDWPRWVLCTIALLPPTLWAAALLHWRLDEAGFIASTLENGWIQNLTALLLALAMLLSARASHRLFGLGWRGYGLLYAILTVVALVLCGEEISWGQRVFGWQTPESWKAINVQDETTLHNLPHMTFALQLLLASAMCVVSVVSAVAWKWRADQVASRRAYLVIPHPILIPAWLTVWNYSGIRQLYKWTHEGSLIRPIIRLQEPSEALFSLGLVLFLCIVLRQLPRLERARKA